MAPESNIPKFPQMNGGSDHSGEVWYSPYANYSPYPGYGGQPQAPGTQGGSRPAAVPPPQPQPRPGTGYAPNGQATYGQTPQGYPVQRTAQTARQDTRVPYTYQGWGTADYSNTADLNRRAAEEKARMQMRDRPVQQSGPNSLGGSSRTGSARSRQTRIEYTPPKNPKVPQKPENGKKKTGLKIKLALIAAFILAAGIGIAVASSKYQAVQKAVAPYDNVFMDQVYVDGICLGGKTWEEGCQLINDHLNLKKNGWFVRIRNAAGEHNDITADTLGINFDPTNALKEAWAVGRTSYSGIRGTLDRQKELEAINAQEYHFSSAEQSASSAPIDTILNTLAAAAYREPQNAQFIGFDPDNTSNPFSYQYEVYGQQLNTEGIKEQIMQYAENLECGEVLLTVDSIAPSVTVNDLCAEHELRAVAYTPISSHSTADRTDNIRLAFSHINGLVLNDGDKFSFNNKVGKRSIENGYKAAVEYQYGAEEWGIGGGVCQASTTVYLAAANAGMTIKTRKPHSMAVSYTDLGLDCTVNDTRGHEIDFVFVNNSGAPIYLTAHVIGRSKKNYQCEVRIYGRSLGNIKYQLKAETVETLTKPAEPKMVEDKSATYVTYTDETKTIEGRDGYKVQSYLVTYENGVEVGRKNMYLDTYPSKADTVYVGVTPRGGV